MRILIEAFGYGVGDNLGGSVRVAATNARALAGRGHEVWFCCTNVVDKRRKLLPGGQVVQRDGLKVVYCDTLTLPFWPGALGPHYSRIPKKLLPPISAFDVVHLTEFRSFLALRIGAAALDARVPVVVQPQGSFLRHYRSRSLKRIYDRFWGDRLASEAAIVIAATRTEAGALTASGIDSGRVRTVPNGIELGADVALPQRGSFRARMGIAPEVPIIMSVGRVDEVKGFDLMLRALAHLPQPALYIVVGPDNGFGDTLTRIATEMGLTSRFLMTGALPAASDVQAAMVDANVMVVPSRYEAFGQVILEGLLARCPLVLSSGCNAADDFADHAALVVPPEPVALAKACRTLLGDAALRQRFADAGYELLYREYTASAVAARLEAIYGEVMRAA